MTAQLMQATAVVTARILNPTIFNQVWLVANRIIPAPTNDPLPGSIFTDLIVQAQAPEFTLVVTPQQLQFALRATTTPGTLVHEKVGQIVRLLPHVPYMAVGLNFVWQSEPLADMGRAGRGLFASGAFPFDQFGSSDSRFGTYASRDIGAVRLRLDVRPGHDADAPQVERLQFTFNFQHELQDVADKATGIVETLVHWDEFRDLAGGIVNATLEAAPR